MLTSLEVTLEEVRAQVEQIVGQGDEVTSGQIPFTPRAKKVLELSLREALSLGHNYIETEHILLGLVRENDGVAARILLDFGADAETIRDEIIRMLSGRGRPDPSSSSRPSRYRPLAPRRSWRAPSSNRGRTAGTADLVGAPRRALGRRAGACRRSIARRGWIEPCVRSAAPARSRRHDRPEAPRDEPD